MIEQRGALFVVHGMGDRIGGLLFRLLFRFAGSESDLHAVDFDRGAEMRMRKRTSFVPVRPENDAMTPFLAPFDQPAFVIGVGAGQIVDIQVAIVKAVDEQPVDKLVTLI